LASVDEWVIVRLDDLLVIEGARNHQSIVNRQIAHSPTTTTHQSPAMG
jgi:hypothetical protein